MPETWDQAGERFARVTQEAVANASGKNILLVTHAEVTHSNSRLFCRF